MPDDLSHPGVVMSRLAAIENDLALRQNSYESAAGRWYGAKRDIEKTKATALLTADEKTVAEKRARGELAAYDVEGAVYEAEYESLKAVIRVLEQRGMILMALLKAQGRT